MWLWKKTKWLLEWIEHSHFITEVIHGKTWLTSMTISGGSIGAFFSENHYTMFVFGALIAFVFFYYVHKFFADRKSRAETKPVTLGSAPTPSPQVRVAIENPRVTYEQYAHQITNISITNNYTSSPDTADLAKQVKDILNPQISSSTPPIEKEAVAIFNPINFELFDAKNVSSITDLAANNFNITFVAPIRDARISASTNISAYMLAPNSMSARFTITDTPLPMRVAVAFQATPSAGEMAIEGHAPNVSIQEFISLADAAQRVYTHGRKKGWLITNGAESLSGPNMGSGSPDEILDYIGLYMMERLPIYAKRPPSTEAERLNKSQLNQCRPRKRCTVLTTLITQEAIYEEPRVKATDLEKFIADEDEKLQD